MKIQRQTPSDDHEVDRLPLDSSLCGEGIGVALDVASTRSLCSKRVYSRWYVLARLDAPFLLVDVVADHVEPTPTTFIRRARQGSLWQRTPPAPEGSRVDLVQPSEGEWLIVSTKALTCWM